MYRGQLAFWWFIPDLQILATQKYIDYKRQRGISCMYTAHQSLLLALIADIVKDIYLQSSSNWVRNQYFQCHISVYGSSENSGFSAFTPGYNLLWSSQINPTVLNSLSLGTDVGVMTCLDRGINIHQSWPTTILKLKIEDKIFQSGSSHNYRDDVNYWNTNATLDMTPRDVTMQDETQIIFCLAIAASLFV